MILVEHLPNLNKKHLARAGVAGLILFSFSFEKDGSNIPNICYEYKGSYTRSASDTPEFQARKIRCLNAGTNPNIFTCPSTESLRLVSKSRTSEVLTFEGRLIKCTIKVIPPTKST